MVKALCMGCMQAEKKMAREAGKSQEEIKKIKTMKEIKNAKVETLESGRKATKGVCPDCGTKMFSFKIEE